MPAPRASSSNLIRSTIIKIFTTKHSLTLPTSSLLYIESVLASHSLSQSDLEELTSGVELWAREYLKGEDPSPLVGLEALKRAYESLQVKTTHDDVGASAYDHHVHHEDGRQDILDGLLDPTEVSPEAHFKIVGAFDMPAIRFDAVRGTFVKTNPRNPPSLAGAPSSRSAYLRERWSIIRQIVLRNENFMAPAVPGGVGGGASDDFSRGGGAVDRSAYLKLTSSRNLLGRAGQLFLLFGMLSRNPEGVLCLEDGEGKVPLDMEEAEPGEGMFTEGCMVLIEGEYTVEETVRVLAMGHPPSERRDAARAIYGHIDFMGIGAMSLKDDERFKPIVLAHEDVSLVTLSDLWLDHPRTLPSLRLMFEGYAAAEVRPLAFVLCGNFSVKGYEGFASLERYTAGFKALTDLILKFPSLAQHSHFIFVPGPTDPWSSSTLPRPPIPDAFTKYVRARLPKAVFTTNPARIRYFNQEIVIFREDLMGRMLRNLVSVKAGMEGMDMKRYLVQTILDQTHLSPLSIHVRPTLWEWDHALSLYPMPTTLILADKYERYDLTYEGCHVFNPGSFVGNHFEWSVYFPSTGRSESSMLPDED